MNLNFVEMLAIGGSVAGILMVGTGHVRVNLFMYALQTILIAAVTVTMSLQVREVHAYFVAVALVVVKALGVPLFLAWVIKRIGVPTDTGAFVPIPVSMHLSIAFFAVSHLLAKSLPAPPAAGSGAGCATAAVSLLFSGLLFMLTRRLAVSQIIGFLTMENGIYLFGLSQTRGMPPIVEMGILLDVLAGVMIAGLIVFKIKQSFEHIDVTQLTGLKES